MNDQGKIFKREERYIVFKLSDLQRHLNPSDLFNLDQMGRTVAAGREQDGKAPLQCVVVESDWPEYETTWQAIEARMSGALTQRPAALRIAQAEAVMPLIGPLLDAWENADREVMSQEPELSKQLKAIDRAMEDASMPAPQQATPEPSRGMIGMGAQALAGELGAALNADLQMENAIGMLGANTMAWLRKVATEYLSRPATPEPVGEPLSDVMERKLRALMGAVNSYEKATGIGGAYAETVQSACNSLLREVGSKVKFGAGLENPQMQDTRLAPGVPVVTDDMLDAFVEVWSGQAVFFDWPEDRQEVLRKACFAMLAAAQAKGVGHD